MTKRVNRFRSVRPVNVSMLPASIITLIIINGSMFVIMAVAFFWLWAYTRTAVQADTPNSKQFSTVQAMVSTTPTLQSTSTPYPTNTSFPTFTPFPTSTPFPTNTPFPTFTPTPTPTATALPTSTHTPTPYPVEYLEQFTQTVASLVQIESNYSLAFYRAYCHDVPGYSFIQPRLITRHLITDEYVWFLNNSPSGYDYSSDLPHNSQTTFYLSERPSDFSIQLFFYGEPVSDRVTVSYPDNVGCQSIEVLYVDAVSPSVPVSDDREIDFGVDVSYD